MIAGSDSQAPRLVAYRRANFATYLPADFLYSPSHFWLAPLPDGIWRVGLTKFAVRMLGEMVDHAFEIELGAPVTSGRILGWIEGFKAISDLFSVADGTFRGGNQALQETITLVNKDPYGAGWLYEVQGSPDALCLEVAAYQRLLDSTIDRLLERQRQEASAGRSPAGGPPENDSLAPGADRC